MEKKFNVDIGRRVSEIEAVSKKLQIKNILWRIIFRGKGLEFEGYRKFAPDDDSSWIDWKASKKANDTLVKVFKEERDLKIFFLVDVSDSMIFGSAEKLKCEYIIELVLALAHLIVMSGDNVGLILYSDRVVKLIKPAKGLKQFFTLQSELLNVENYGGKSNLGKIMREIMGILDDSINSIFLVSDFLNIKNTDEINLRLFGKRWETIALVVKDMRDLTMPEDVREIVVSDSAGKELFIDPKLIRGKYESYAYRQERAVKNLFLKSQIDSLDIITKKPFVLPLVSFLKSRIERRKYIMPR